MDFVRPWLAVGTAAEAADAESRQRAGIDAILSLVDVGFSAGKHHLALPVADRKALDGEAIALATRFLAAQQRAGRRTLLHCRSGISRSPALAACHLHEHEGLSLAAALAEVAAARPQAAPDPALLASIAEHYGTDLPEPAPHLDLSANENPLGASPLARAVLALPEAHRYPDRGGLALRRALARELGGGPDCYVLGNGSSEILDLASRALLALGDAAIVVPPCFPSYSAAIRRAHGRLVSVPARAEDGYAVPYAAILDAIEPCTRLILLGNPNNPTGRGLATPQLDDFLARLPDGVIVLLDEAYRDYHGDRDCEPCAPDAPLAYGPALVAAGRPVLVVRSFSKLHGLAGLRVGFAYGDPALIARLDALRSPFNVNAPAQAAALAALEDREHQQASRRLAADGRRDLAIGLAGLGFRCPPCLGNFVLAHRGAAMPAVAEIVESLRLQGIAVKDGNSFGLPDALRVSIGRPDDHRRLFAALGAILASPAEANLQGS